MKKAFLIFLLFLSVLSLTAQTGTEPVRQESTEYKLGANYMLGARFSYNIINSLLGDDETANKQNLMFGLLEFRAELSEYLTIGVMAGYNFSHLKENVDFHSLPLSLRLSQEKYQSLLFGIHIHSDFLSFGYYTFRAQGEFLYALTQKKEWPIELPIEEGTANIKQGFYLATADLLLQYDGFVGVMPFGGVRANITNGQFNAEETVADLNGTQKLAWRQKTLIGPMGGVTFEPGGNWEITLTASLLCRFAADLRIQYNF